MRAPTPHSREAERLALLTQCGILDTSPEPDFDQITALASAICDTPIALVSLVDGSRQWFKSHHGLAASETPRQLAFCAHAILDSEEALLVEDARKDPRFAENPLVLEEPHVGFYAGIPLKVGPDRLPVGTLCVIDPTPKRISIRQISQLKILARQVEVLLELRLRQNQLEERLDLARASEERLQAVVTAMNEGLVVQSHDGTIISCNPAAERILGLTGDQLRGRTSVDPRWRSVHGDGSPYPGHEHPSMVSLRTGRPVAGAIMGVHTKDEELRWIYINSQPIGRRSDGLPDSVATTFTDITALRRKEAESERFFSLSLELLALAEYSGRLLRLNPAWEKTLGWTVDEMLGRNFMEFVHPDDQAMTVRAAQHIQDGGELIRFVNRYRCKDGSWRKLSWNTSGSRVDNLYFAVARDVTAECDHEEALRLAKEQAEAANRAKSAFLATMSHEIRTPMNGVLGMAQIIAETKLDAEQRDILATLQHSGQSLLTIINDILDWSKIQAGMMELHPESLSIQEAIDATLKSFQVAAQAKNLRLELLPGERPRVRADPHRLRQILTNLIGNALKFTTQGSVTVGVEPRTDGQVAIVIRDTGIGIPAKHLPRLFTRFTQVDDSHSRKFSGTGLGLAISQQLAEAMGGRISVASRSDEGIPGSTFTVFLPAAPDAPETSAGHRTVSDTDLGSAQAPKRALRILVAEDNPVNQRVIRSFLTRMGHVMDLAVDGRQAQEFWRIGTYDAVLMDVQMPEVDGLEATRLIRTAESQGSMPHCPILALTASAMSEERMACLAAGMDQVLTKPLAYETLEQVLKDLPRQGGDVHGSTRTFR